MYCEKLRIGISVIWCPLNLVPFGKGYVYPEELFVPTSLNNIAVNKNLFPSLAGRKFQLIIYYFSTCFANIMISSVSSATLLSAIDSNSRVFCSDLFMIKNLTLLMIEVEELDR